MLQLKHSIFVSSARKVLVRYDVSSVKTVNWGWLETSEFHNAVTIPVQHAQNQ